MKKNLGFPLLILTLAALLAACGAPAYADLRAVLDKILTATDTLVSSMDKAKDAKAVGAAISAYTEAVKAEQAGFQAMMKKYPDLKDAKDPPKELKESVDKLNSMGEKLMAAMTKIQTYAEDPVVKEAVQKMSELQLQ